MSSTPAQPGLQSLSKSFEPAALEALWGPAWEHRAYGVAGHRGTGQASAEAAAARQNFAIQLPPPNVTGTLHMALKTGICTALVGANGAGKSTLLLLLSRLELPSTGEIYLNNTLLSTLPHSTIAGLYGYVPQNVFIFGDSLRMNITMGRDIPDDQIFDTITNIG